jgi:putative DNA methylase
MQTGEGPHAAPHPVAETVRAQGDAPAFIEVQFPVSKLSKECYKERKAGSGQTLNPLGKWWGRKPLVLVRAILLGLLMPATDDPAADREAFLAALTMDDDGMLRRFTGQASPADLAPFCTPRERAEYFVSENGKLSWRPGLSAADREHLKRRAFLRMGYDDRLRFCLRPEEVDGPSEASWERINRHLGTTARSLPDLVRQLGERRFGHVPRVGDAFCGGGSVPFEAARLGCEAYASDLNPVAVLLTWGALALTGGGPEVVERVRAAQRRVFEDVRRQVEAWGIERNEEGWVADAYLYCHEVRDPLTGWWVPLAPTWVISRKRRVVAKLVPDPVTKRFAIEIHEGVSEAELRRAEEAGTWASGVRCPVDRDGNWLPPAQRQVTSAEQLRGRTGLRPWENDDLVPRPDDVFQERLYCIRWIDPETGERFYRAPTAADLAREQRVLELVRARFAEWQDKGYLPSARIEPGYNTDQPVRERGWTHWHHLFNPRQLLLHGLLAERAAQEAGLEAAALLLMLGRVANWNSRLSLWNRDHEKIDQTFLNQALNTLVDYACRAMGNLETAFCARLAVAPVAGPYHVQPADARVVKWEADIWITDPGYGDYVNYHELSEFFLAWYEKRLPQLFPGWYADSKRVLAVKGEEETFRLALAECYQNLARRMPDDGYQVVLFVHQDPEMWVDLTLVLWAAGLQVTAAWTVLTETTRGIRSGNYVQGTVLLVLRKRQGDRRGELVDLYPEIRAEVERQLETMLRLDPKDDPNFGDADYQLAAYAAALRVLTSYSAIGDIDVERELRRPRSPGEVTPIGRIIEQAVRIATDYLVPEGLERTVWRQLSPEERLYLKGIEIEAHGEAREGAYQEFARTYGAREFRSLLASRSANRARLKTPSEFGNRELRPIGQSGFGGTLLRHVLFAIYRTASDPEQDPRPARQYLRQEVPDYWQARQTIIALLQYLGTKPVGLAHWQPDVQAARRLKAVVEADTL